MKSLKEHKVQILAAIALAFSLGMVVPGAAFASTDVAAQAESSAATQVSVNELLAVIQQAQGVDNYGKYANLVNGYNGLTAATPVANAVPTAVAAVKALITDAPLTNESTVAAVKTYIENMDAYKTWAPVVNTINTIVTDTGAANASAITATGLAKYKPEQIAQYYNTINNVVNPMPATYAENIVVLAGRVKTNGAFANYWTYEPIVAGALALEAKPGDAAIRAELAKNVANIMKVTGASELSTEALLTQAKSIENYDQYVALYNSMNFIREALPEGVTDVSKITANELNTKYPAAADGKSPLVDYYVAMGRAAKVIDASVVNNLIPFEMPTTSAPEERPKEDDNKVNTPNTGIVGLIESGALDLGTVTLIASVAVAGIAGVGIIAKLYLRKKF